MQWISGPSTYTLASFTTSNGTALLAMSTARTAPARGASLGRAVGFASLCISLRVLPEAPCPPALNLFTRNSPSFSAYAFKTCVEYEPRHDKERERSQDHILAYALRLPNSNSTARAIATQPLITT